MLKLLGAKLWAWAAMAGAILLAVVGYQRKVINDQNHEIKLKNKKNELRDESDEFERQNELEEEKANEERKQNIVDLTPDDKWNKL